MLYYATLYYDMLYYAILCHHMLYYAILCHHMLYYATLSYFMLLYAIICCIMLSYAISCYHMLYYAIICYTIVSEGITFNVDKVVNGLLLEMDIIPAKITNKTDLSVQRRPLAVDTDIDNAINNDSVLISTSFDSPAEDFSTVDKLDLDNIEKTLMLENGKTDKNQKTFVDEKAKTEKNQKNSEIEEINLPMKGWKIVFTGRLEKLTRGEAEVICNSLGGDVTDSINKKVKILVCAGEESGYVQ